MVEGLKIIDNLKMGNNMSRHTKNVVDVTLAAKKIHNVNVNTKDKQFYEKLCKGLSSRPYFRYPL